MATDGLSILAESFAEMQQRRRKLARRRWSKLAKVTAWSLGGLKVTIVLTTAQSIVCCNGTIHLETCFMA